MHNAKFITIEGEFHRFKEARKHTEQRTIHAAAPSSEPESDDPVF